MAVGTAAPLNVGLQSVHVDRTVVFVPVFSLVVGSVAVFLLLHRPDPLLQLDQTGHLRGDVVLLASWRGRLVAAVLLVLVGHHLLDADHRLGLADQRHLWIAEAVGGEVRLCMMRHRHSTSPLNSEMGRCRCSLVASFAAVVEEESLAVSSMDQISSWAKTMLQCSVLKMRQVDLRPLLHSTTRGHWRCFGITNTLEW